MNLRNINIKLVFTSLAALLFLISIYHYSQTRVTYKNFELTYPGNHKTAIPFPFKMGSNNSNSYKINGVISKNLDSGALFKIVPDDELISIKVNGKDVDLSAIPKEKLRDYNNGFDIDLKQYLTANTNSLEIIFFDTGGMMGMGFESLSEKNAIHIIQATFLLLVTALIFATRLQTPLKLLLVLGLAIRLFYFDITPSDTRAHDETEHVEFAQYLSKHWLPPPLESATGGAFFHPPFYYYTSAVVIKISEALGLNALSGSRLQQILSLTYSMGFLFFGLLILEKLLSVDKQKQSAFNMKNLRRNADNNAPFGKPMFNTAAKPVETSFLDLKKPWLYLITASLFTFWPSNIIHSVRIGNDPCLYFLLTASIYYIYCWFDSDKFSHLIVGSIFAALAILTKANAEIMIPVIGIIGLYKMIKSKRWAYYFKSAILPVLLITLALAITVGPGLMLKLQGKRDKLFIDNINNVSSALQVGNNAANYLWFDFKTFINEPFTSPWQDEKGRQYFWNYLSKTGLFGEFNYDGKVVRNAGTVSSFLFLCMFAFVILGLYHFTKSDLKRVNVIALSGFFLLAGVTYMRMTFPVNIDFRYISPITVSFCAVYALCILRYMKIGKDRMAYIGSILAILFTLSNIIFTLSI